MRCCSPCTRPAGAGPPFTPATPTPAAGFADAYDALIDRRTRREPIAYITGVQEFWDRDFTVSPAVLIPRPETELIIEEALSLRLRPSAADIGTGSGCLAVTLAAELPARPVRRDRHFRRRRSAWHAPMRSVTASPIESSSARRVTSTASPGRST